MAPEIRPFDFRLYVVTDRQQTAGRALEEVVIAAARYSRFRQLRITSTATNLAMRALARKFGARFTFEAGEATGLLPVHPAKAMARPSLHADHAGIAAE